MRKGIYYYKFMAWDEYGRRVLKSHKMRVEILDDAGARYLVRYMEPHANGDRVNSTHRVGKNKVTLSALEVKPVPEGVRLPYKDND